MANSDNPRRGAEFEGIAKSELASLGMQLEKDFNVDIGISLLKKPHNFDLGSFSPPVLVECKRHTWTESGNAPSAKLTVWNEAMYYFTIAPKEFRKILFVLKSIRRGESLSEYYIKRFEHLIPNDVEIWEYDLEIGNSSQVYPEPSTA